MAKSEDYLDDRSSPESLIRSLYSAINNHEYARAWSYYGDAPAKDYETYSRGFATTDHVDVLTGDMSGDGAAGSTYFNVPVAIRAKDAKGSESYFAGCYVLRQVNGQIQQPPFRPLNIQSAKLKPIKKDDYSRFTLPKCGVAQRDAQQVASTVETAKTKFTSEMQGRCDKVADTRAGINEPLEFHLSFKPTGDDQEIKQLLFAFSCTLAAYNESNVFYLDDGVEGLRRVSFADAASSGTWVINDRGVFLETYAIDPTYDEEHNEVTVVEKGQLILKP